MPSDYILIDFGDGRRLESFGGYKVDRPCPAAYDCVKQLPNEWTRTDAKFDAQVGNGWTFRNPWPVDLTLQSNGFLLRLAPKPFGHIGAFPEQADNWCFLQTVASKLGVQTEGLNLFAYTGGSSLALANGGVSVVHVDASKPSVARARENAELSDLKDSPIRYIIDDAPKFTAREVRRKRAYDIIALDPPAYGHGPKGNAWRLERDLWPLLTDCFQLLSQKSAILLTGHSESPSAQEIVDWIRTERSPNLSISHRRSTIMDASGRKLDAGFSIHATWNIQSD